MLAPTEYSSITVIPPKGIFVFGGRGNTLMYAQTLKSLDGAWEIGPELFENRTIGEQCLVQVYVLNVYLTFF